MTNVNNSIVDADILKKVIEHKKYNEIIFQHYNTFRDDDEFLHNYISNVTGRSLKAYKDTLTNKLINLDNCNKYWVLDKYKKQKVKDLISQNLCRDRFCSNCKKVTQSARMSKYIPEMEQYKNRLYHLTLTQPNVKGSDLRSSVRHMSKCFAKFIRYLSGNIKINGIDFSSWGYEGGIRSLEVTFKKDSYHPHYHVALVLQDNMISDTSNINKYSYDNRRGKESLLNRIFCDEEILIQKIWYLLINGIRVNKNNIDNLQDGYSCTMDKFEEENYSELFKYLTKEKDESNELLTYENFKYLYYGLYNIKQIQGYGVLYRIKDTIDLEEFELMYRDFIEELKHKERPSRVLETPESLLDDTDYKLISRKSYYKYLRESLNS